MFVLKTVKQIKVLMDIIYLPNIVLNQFFFTIYFKRTKENCTERETKEVCGVILEASEGMGSGHSPLWAVGFCSRQSLAVGCHPGTEGDWTTSKSERCSHG